jgi:hypothetical protein
VPRPKTKETWHLLTSDHLELILKLARSRGPGRYTLKEIHGDQWQFVLRRRRFGILFKRAVDAGVLAGIRWVGRKSNKSQLYEVLA